MKSEDIYKALGKADDDLLEKSESGTESLKNSASRRRKKIKRVSLAACFALLLTAAVTSAVLFGKNNGAFTAGPRPKDLAEAYYLESSDGSGSYLPNGEFSDAVTSFGIRLFAGAYSESENTLLSVFKSFRRRDKQRIFRVYEKLLGCRLTAPRELRLAQGRR